MNAKGAIDLLGRSCTQLASKCAHRLATRGIRKPCDECAKLRVVAADAVPCHWFEAVAGARPGFGQLVARVAPCDTVGSMKREPAGAVQTYRVQEIGGAFVIVPYDMHGRPVLAHALASTTFPTKDAAEAAIERYLRQLAAADRGSDA